MSRGGKTLRGVECHRQRITNGKLLSLVVARAGTELKRKEDNLERLEKYVSQYLLAEVPLYYPARDKLVIARVGQEVDVCTQRC